MLTAVAFGPRRRLAWAAALTYVAVVGGSTLALGLTSHGWYVFYVFLLLSEHTLNHAAFGQFWTVHLLPCWASPALPWCWGCAGHPWCWWPAVPRVVVESYATLVHSGGEVNDMLPAYLAVALLAGLAMGGQPGGLVNHWTDRLARGGLRTGGRNWRAGGRRRGGRSGHRAAGHTDERLPSGPGDPDGRGPRRRPAADGGDARPGRPGRGPLRSRSRPAGGAAGHRPPGATDDVLRGADPAVIASFRRSAARAVAARRFSAIVTQNAGSPDGFPPAWRAPIAAARRRCSPACRRRCSSHRPGRPGGRSTYGCRTPRRARRRSARSTARPPPRRPPRP